ncbi:SnoaL-like domain-containing protein [Phyllobacterium sp. 628]|uniref:nuclear transport factor 2 family protein n=1 Tax=Phyllobacterium sp. 628 TaxID=2718938 RepID=UPI0016626EC1|nr:nuclear transport factor 2 family protein [Phyllobacterium sp. 628]QND53249.1 SnoaL-like domain-containing protein [Phyllobacterium sp. 628]
MTTIARSARAVFEAQIQCILTDDRTTQMSLFAEDCVWEFPFAGADRPKRIEGRAEIERIMAPIWERGRQMKLPPATYTPLAIHETADPECIIAEFLFGPSGEGNQLTFVQVVYVRDGKIRLMREYADHLARTRLIEKMEAAG